MKVLPFRFLQALAFLCMLMASTRARDVLVNPRKLELFVDELPIIPTVMGYSIKDGVPVPRELIIGMFATKWKFHRDLPYTPVFAYGPSSGEATVPGPTIEALRKIETRVRWQNHLPWDHILPWDPTVQTAIPPPRYGGVPAVVHVHGAIVPPASDGNSKAWFTSGFKSTGPNWSREVYSYPNVQEPGNLWYHDHALGLTRVNILAGLFGAYIVRDPAIDDPLGLPSGPLLDRVLAIFDRNFLINGSIYMNTTGNNPSIHPQWQPEYFGNVVLVNGKAWPFLRVRRQKYRFRILNASNARFYRLFFSDSGMHFAHVGSDSVYLERPRRTRWFLLAPSEIADVVVDFSEAEGEEMVLMNDANYPYPSGDAVDKETNGKVMKFIVNGESKVDASHVPGRLLSYPLAEVHQARKKRYIALYEYTNRATDEPTHLLINGKRLVDPATEKPRAGTTEMWEVINLTDDNHPLHVHLGLFQVLHARALEGLEDFKKCMYEKNDAHICDVRRHAVGKTVFPPAHESGWKNVYKMIPGYTTRILVRFAMLSPDLNGSYNYPFDASVEPGYVYHCHIYDHEDNEMMRPLKIVY